MSWSAKNPSDIPQLFCKAWNERRPDKIAELFFDKAEFVNVVGLWWHTKKDIYQAHKYGLEVIFKDSHLTVTKIKVTEITESVALVHARMHLKGQTATNTSKPKDRYNIFSFVALKEGDHWLCISAHNTDVVPGTETNLRDENGFRSVSYRSKSKK